MKKELGFTLAEGTTYVDMYDGYCKITSDTVKDTYVDISDRYRRCAFNKPSRGTNDSERPTIMPVMNIARMSQVRCTGATGFDCRQGAETRRWRMSKKANWRRYRLSRGAVSGFTLAEVLITLGIIGVVAAMTIPVLVSNIQSKVTESQRKVANARLVEGLNMLNIKENGLSVHYGNTEEFVRALSKHTKLVQICGANELDKCFPYENINYDKNGQTKQIKVSNLITPDTLKLSGEGWLEPAGFITANGIPYIISFNNNCSGTTDVNEATIIDPDRPIPCNKDTGCQIPYQCIDGIYDLNGAKSPNKMNKDVESIHLARVSPCIKEIGNLCLTTKAFIGEPVTFADCEANYKGTLVNECHRSTWSNNSINNEDRWLGALVACKKSGGHLPNKTEARSLVALFYKDANGNHPNLVHDTWTSPKDENDNYIYSLDSNRFAELGIPFDPYSNIWTGAERDSGSAYLRGISPYYSNYTYTIRQSTGTFAFCIED